MHFCSYGNCLGINKSLGTIKISLKTLHREHMIGKEYNGTVIKTWFGCKDGMRELWTAARRGTERSTANIADYIYGICIKSWQPTSRETY